MFKNIPGCTSWSSTRECVLVIYFLKIWFILLRHQQCHSYRGDERRREPDGLLGRAVPRRWHLRGLSHHRLAEREIQRHGQTPEGEPDRLTLIWCIWIISALVYFVSLQITIKSKESIWEFIKSLLTPGQDGWWCCWLVCCQVQRHAHSWHHWLETRLLMTSLAWDMPNHDISDQKHTN